MQKSARGPGSFPGPRCAFGASKGRKERSRTVHRAEAGREIVSVGVALELHDPTFSGLYFLAGDSLKLVYNLQRSVLVA